jgi:transcriptional regulator with XRE-family HTH domain
MPHEGEILKELFDRENVNTSALADRLKVNRTTIYYWFKQPKLTLDHILQVGQFLKMDMSQHFPRVKSSGVVAEPEAVYEDKVDHTKEIEYLKEQIKNLQLMLEDKNKIIENQEMIISQLKKN